MKLTHPERRQSDADCARMESAIRYTLQQVRRIGPEDRDAVFQLAVALVQISGSVGAHSGRGYELPRNWADQWLENR